ncbi:MAG: GPR endopeptidase [Clostridia bacterium]|nr:GPR endopeptidase [Clostridia bacterium]
MKKYMRTDLVCESVDAATLPSGELEKICVNEQIDGFEVTRVTVREEHRELVGKPKGSYVTVDCGSISYLTDAERERLSALLAREIRTMCRALCHKEPDKDFSVLVVGLGNEEITADAIGPRAARRLTATRHLRRLNGALYDTVGRCEISVLFTGVLGQTGMESVEMVRGAAENVRPHLVLALDALAARSSARLAATVQLCDSGIAPGSGVGNERKAIDLQTVGVPVIALGVPTVVSSATLVLDALERAGVQEIGEDLKEVLENGRSFFVTPKESDMITESVSSLLADAVDLAFCVKE